MERLAVVVEGGVVAIPGIRFDGEGVGGVDGALVVAVDLRGALEMSLDLEEKHCDERDGDADHFHVLQGEFRWRDDILGPPHMRHVAPVVRPILAVRHIRGVVYVSVDASSADDIGEVVDSRGIRGVPAEINGRIGRRGSHEAMV